MSTVKRCVVALVIFIVALWIGYLRGFFDGLDEGLNVFKANQ